MAGPLKGTELELIPSQLVPRTTWREAHPDTLALMAGTPSHRGEMFYAGYVFGASLGDSATAFPTLSRPRSESSTTPSAHIQWWSS